VRCERERSVVSWRRRGVAGNEEAEVRVAWEGFPVPERSIRLAVTTRSSTRSFLTAKRKQKKGLLFTVQSGASNPPSKLGSLAISET
jgi:hypothetical protein